MPAPAVARALAPRLARAVCAHPRAVLLLAALLTIGATFAARRLALDTDVVDLLPRRLETAAAFGRFAKAFGAEQALVVLAEGDDPAALRRFADAYAAALARSPLVRSVRHRVGPAAAAFLERHLAALLDEADYDELAARATPAALAARARRFRALAQAPGGGAVLERLTHDPLELLPLVARRLGAGRSADPETGYFAAPDGRALLLFVTPRAPATRLDADAALERLARATAAALPAGRGVRVRLTGAPAYHLAYATLLRGDLTRSTIFSLVAVLLLFAGFFRVVRVLPWLALALGAGILWTLGAAALLFHRVGAVSLAFAALLLGIGIDVPVQLYNRLREELRTRPPRDAVAATLEDLLGPAVVALLGPAAVFAACGLSQFRGLAELGVLAAVGLGLGLVASLALFPALLLTLPPALWLGRPTPPPAPRLLGPYAALLARRPWPVVAAVAVAVVLAAPVAAGLRVTPHLLTQRPAGLAPAATDAAIDAAFGRGGGRVVLLAEAHDLETALRAEEAWARAGAALQAARIARGQDSLAPLLPSAATQARRRARLAAVDPARLARDLETAFAAVGLRPEPFVAGLAPLRAPAPVDLAALRASPLGWAVPLHLRRAGGGWMTATYLHPTPTATATPAGGTATPLARALRARAREVAAAVPDARVTATGTPLLDTALRAGLERDLLLTTVAAFLLTLMALVGYYRRLRPVALVVISLGAAWVLFAAAMRLLGVPLDLFTLLSVPFVLGYGIDDHVFLVHRAGAGVAAAVTTTGRAIALTSFTTAAGFGGLLLARHEGLRQLGAAGSVAVLASLLAALLLAPALLRLLLPPR